MGFNHQICMLVLDDCAKKHLINYSTKKGWNRWNTFDFVKTICITIKILVQKVTLGSIGCDSNATTKSTSIFPPSLYSSLPCILNSMQIRNGLPFYQNQKVASPNVASLICRSLGVTSIAFHLSSRIQMPFEKFHQLVL